MVGRYVRLCAAMAALAAGLWATEQAFSQTGPEPCTPQTPCLTYTNSYGERSEENYFEGGRENYRYETRITARMEGGAIVYDETSYRNFDDAMTQALIMDARLALEAEALGQGPGIVITELRFVEEDYSEEIEDVFTETSYTYNVYEEHSTQTTYGGMPNSVVPTGYRGFCSDVGQTGTTNAPPNDGRFALCDGYEDEFFVEAGYVNQNHHSNTVYSSTTTSFTNTDIVIRQHYEMIGRLFLIGFVHPAVGQAAIEAGRGFYERMARQAEPAAVPAQGDAGGEPGMAVEQRFGLGPMEQADTGVRVWAQGYAGWASTDNSGVHRGSERDAAGFSGGVHYYPSGNWNFGLAVDYGATQIRENSGTEHGELDVAQFGLLVAYDPGAWFVRAAATYGFGRAETRQGNAMLGGVASANYSVDVATVTAEAGLRLQLGSLEVTPLAGIDWVSVQTGAFAGQGGFALGANSGSHQRSSAWADIGASQTWQFDGGQMLRVRAGGRLSAILSGETLVMPVHFVANPGTNINLTGATEGRLAGEARLGLEFEPTEHVAFHATVSGRWDDRGGDTHTVAGGLRIRW